MKNQLKDAMMDVGTNPDTLSKYVNEATAMAGEFAAKLVQKTASQALYDQLTNVPQGIHPANYEPKQAFLMALAETCGAAIKWDVDTALELAADILEDVNAHGEAAKVRAMRFTPVS